MDTNVNKLVSKLRMIGNAVADYNSFGIAIELPKGGLNKYRLLHVLPSNKLYENKDTEYFSITFKKNFILAESHSIDNTIGSQMPNSIPGVDIRDHLFIRGNQDSIIRDIRVQELIDISGSNDTMVLVSTLFKKVIVTYTGEMYDLKKLPDINSHFMSWRHTRVSENGKNIELFDVNTLMNRDISLKESKPIYVIDSDTLKSIRIR